MSMLDRVLRYRPALLGASLLAFGWAWYERAHVDAHSGPLPNGGLTFAVVSCYLIAVVLLLFTWRPRVLWEKGPERSRNLLRAAVALIPLVGLAFMPEVPRLSPTASAGSRAWYERDGRYFVEFDPDTPFAIKKEITKAEYDEVDRRGVRMVATIHFIFAYAAVCVAWITLVWPPAPRRAPAS
jgi:hypothetical protein